MIPDSIAQEAAPDDIYIIRTSVPAAALSCDEAVRSYKLLTQVEQAFAALSRSTSKSGPSTIAWRRG